jgi:hypothetical protein
MQHIQNTCISVKSINAEKVQRIDQYRLKLFYSCECEVFFITTIFCEPWCKRNLTGKGSKSALYYLYEQCTSTGGNPIK